MKRHRSGSPTQEPKAAATDDAAAPAAAPTAAASAIEAQVAALEAEVARLHKQAQALNKQAGREGEATVVYKKLAALDDEALQLRLGSGRPPPPSAERLAAHAAAFPAYCGAPPPPPTWQQAAGGPAGAAAASAQHLRQRALGAVLGAALGDAAACGVQWVYSEPELQRLLEGGRPGLEWYDPPQCPFFNLPPGAASPYGEQAAALLRSLVACGGLDPGAYAAALYREFGPGYCGYRDRSVKSFLRRHAAGALPPLTGAADDQANAFARLPPLVALYAGAGRHVLLGAAERAIRVTQNDPIAVAYGCAAALVLEAVLLGSSATAAVAEVVDWLQQQQAQVAAAEAAEAKAGDVQQQQQQQQQAPAVPDAMWGEVADRLLQAAEAAPLLPLDAATQLGRNCHLPSSLQTPLQVVLHLEWRQQQQVQPGDDAATAAAADSSSPPGAPEGTALHQAGAGRPPPADDFCLPCSMGGGTACALPSRQARQAAAAAGGLLQAARQQREGQGQPAALPPGTFEDAVRLAIRPGGCCASRAGFVGALVGALTAGPSAPQLPAEWAAKMRGYADLAAAAERLAVLRD